MTDRELYDLHACFHRGEIGPVEYLDACEDVDLDRFRRTQRALTVRVVVGMVGATALLCLTAVVAGLSDGLALAFALPAYWAAAFVFGFVSSREIGRCRRCKHEMGEWWRRQLAEQGSAEWWQRGGSPPEWSGD